MLAETGKAAVPHEVMFHLVAARYGMSPEQVRKMPAKDYLIAVQLLRITGGK